MLKNFSCKAVARFSHSRESGNPGYSLVFDKLAPGAAFVTNVVSEKFIQKV